MPSLSLRGRQRREQGLDRFEYEQQRSRMVRVGQQPRERLRPTVLTRISGRDPQTATAAHRGQFEQHVDGGRFEAVALDQAAAAEGGGQPDRPLQTTSEDEESPARAAWHAILLKPDHAGEGGGGIVEPQ